MDPEQKLHKGTPLNESGGARDATPLKSESDSVTPSDIPGSTRAGWSPVVAKEQNRSGRSGIRGVVRGFEMRAEKTALGGEVSVWTFRVERYDPKASGTLPPIQVVILATTFDSSIHDGDEIEVFGNLKAGRPIKAKRVHNLTTGTTVNAWTSSFYATLLVALLLWGATLYLSSGTTWEIALITGVGASGVTVFVLNQLGDKWRFR